jgi:predicted alpha/beta superfamily hydrolase
MIPFRRALLRWTARRRSRPGRVETLENVESPELGNARSVYVYLPGSYAHGTRRFPVIYMQDGQNLFDPALSFAGSWRVDEAVESQRRRSSQAIIVGVANAGAERLHEYSPFDDPEHGGGRGDQYIEFVSQTLKPMIDERFRTLTAPANTGIAGSSMGGLISLYGFFTRPDVFGFCAALSPSLWFALGGIFSFVEHAPMPGGRIYLDVGTGEGARTLYDVHRLRDMLVEKGYVAGRTLRYIEDDGGKHHEAAWGRRFRMALPWLLGRD